MNLTLKQKLYQLIISRIDGDTLSSDTYRREAMKLIQNGIGGFIIFGGSKDAVKEFITGAQSEADIPLFIASDIEKGVGQQMEGATVFPCQMALAAATDFNNPDDLKAFDAVFGAIADEALDVGINMPFIPVLDVNLNADNPIICTRAFSDDPQAVSRFGDRAVRILENSGLFSCAKHFPGHGDTTIDSHISLPVISKSRDALINEDIVPFRAAVDAQVSSIMMAHIIMSAIDDSPASLSYAVIQGLLREELGYSGLVLTDALTMDALNDYDNVPSRCIQAGADIILHPADANAVADEIGKAVASGSIKESTIDGAIERIRKYKGRLKNLRQSEVDYDEHARLARMIAGKAVTLVKSRPGILPFKNLDESDFVYSADRDKHDVSVLSKAARSFMDVRAVEGKTLRGTVIVNLFTRIAAWEGSSGIVREEAAVIKKIIRNAERSVVISFGSPYVLRHFSGADALIAAYDSDHQAQEAVLKVLTGKIDFRGSLPVSLDRD